MTIQSASCEIGRSVRVLLDNDVKNGISQIRPPSTGAKILAVLGEARPKFFFFRKVNL